MSCSCCLTVTGIAPIVVASWSIHCLYEKDVTGSTSMLIPHVCPAQPDEHREEALPLLVPTYTARLLGEHKEHGWPSPVPSLLMIRWSLLVQCGTHNIWIAAAGPKSSVYSGAAPRAPVLLHLMAPESTSPWGLQLTTAAGHSPFLVLRSPHTCTFRAESTPTQKPVRNQI